MNEQPFVPLAPGEVRVRSAVPDEVTSPEVLARYERLLDATERERHGRFHFDRDRKEYLVAHALLRRTLSQCAPIAPEAWRFTRNAYGRPAVEDAPDLPQFQFNLSHTRGLTACAVTREVAVGIDVEWLNRSLDTAALMPHVFSPEEERSVRTLPLADRRPRFFEIWTLKEAYIKARGMGLALPLREFTFSIREESQVRIVFQPSLADDPSSWQFCLMAPTPEHRLALAIRRGAGMDLALDVKQMIP